MAGGEDGEKVPHRRNEDRPPSLSAPLPREKLPKDLQKIIDREDDFFDSLYEGQFVHLKKNLPVRSPGSEPATPPRRITDMPPTPVVLGRFF